jgi:hypothetical protein
MPGLHPVLMSQLTNTKEHLVRIWTTLRAWTVPQDGFRRYLYDIWQPLTILVLTASFAGVFFLISAFRLFYLLRCHGECSIRAGVRKSLWAI